MRNCFGGLSTKVSYSTFSVRLVISRGPLSYLMTRLYLAQYNYIYHSMQVDTYTSHFEYIIKYIVYKIGNKYCIWFQE